MSPTHTRKGGRLYRYYVSQAVLKQSRDACPVGRLPAAEIEAAVIDQVRGLLRAPEIVVGTWRASKTKVDGLSEEQVRRALQDLDPLWDELFPAEQARIVQLLVERIDVGTPPYPWVPQKATWVPRRPGQRMQQVEQLQQLRPYRSSAFVLLTSDVERPFRTRSACPRPDHRPELSPGYAA